MAFNFGPLLSAACGGAPRRLGRLRRPWARCARLFWGGYQHRKSAVFYKNGHLYCEMGKSPPKAPTLRVCRNLPLMTVSLSSLESGLCAALCAPPIVSRYF